jgi:hypothetical protein
MSSSCRSRREATASAARASAAMVPPPSGTHARLCQRRWQRQSRDSTKVWRPEDQARPQLRATQGAESRLARCKGRGAEGRGYRRGWGCVQG